MLVAVVDVSGSYLDILEKRGFPLESILEHVEQPLVRLFDRILGNLWLLSLRKYGG